MRVPNKAWKVPNKAWKVPNKAWKVVIFERLTIVQAELAVKSIAILLKVCMIFSWILFIGDSNLKYTCIAKMADG